MHLFPFFKGGGGEFSMFIYFLVLIFFMQNLPHVPVMRKGIQCIWI